MALDNYRDQSTGSSAVNAGFQFEFYCTTCSRKWKSPFQPYRMGQLTGFLSRFSFLFNGMSTAARATSGAADYGARKSWEEALAKAQAQAAERYAPCGSCKAVVCDQCLDSSGTCPPCVELASGTGGQQQTGAKGGAALACPNCHTASSGGRFCAECGFDMASTHKSCPGCGGMCERQARFCGDCGHGF